MTDHNPDEPSPWAGPRQQPDHPDYPDRPAESNPWTGQSQPAPSEPNRWAGPPPNQPHESAAEPNPWGAQPRQPESPQTPHRGQEQVLFGSAYGGSGGFSGPPTIPPQYQRIPEQPGSRPGRRGVVAGVTVLALIVGGAAGAAGGYLASSNSSSASGPTVSALDQQPPAKQTAAPPAGTVEAAAQKVLPSLVELQVQGQSQGRTVAGEGSGFVISADGLIVTNNHVVAEAVDGGKIVAVFQSGKTANVSIVGRDPNSDVAVVRAQGASGLTTVELGRSDDLRVGQTVVAFGSPFELTGTVTAGIVSSLHRPTRAGGDQGDQATVMDAIQTDAAINPGNSGGPLTDIQGRVVGINSAIYSPSSGNSDAGSVGIGFAIPIDQARRTADEIAKTGKATQTVLGVSVTDNQPSGSGAQVKDVTANGPAQKAGIQPGDVVTQLDDRRIDTSDALVAAVRAHAPGDSVKVVLGNGSRTIDVTLAGQPV